MWQVYVTTYPDRMRRADTEIFPLSAHPRCTTIKEYKKDYSLSI
jgi:hypothetical protein